MPPFRHLLLVGIAAGAAVVGTAATSPAQQVYTLDPPADIADLLGRLKRDEGWAAATRGLAARDDAAPYLRAELATARDPLHRRNLKEALGAIEGRTRERNRARFDRWAKDRRLDLCNELIVACPDNREAVGLVDHLLPVVHKIGAAAAEKFDLPFRSPRGVLLPDPFNGRPGGFLHLAGEEVTVGRNGYVHSPTVVRADRCELAVNQMSDWFVAARSGVRHTPRGENSQAWDCSVALVNSGMTVMSANSSVIVCDGDVEFLSNSVHKSVIIANGTIHGAPGSRSILWATGDIVIHGRPKPKADRNRLYAGGSAKFAGPGESDERVQEKVTERPFGVRFLDPREFGLELAAEKGGLRVAKLADWSPFARYGVREGDVVTKVNDVAADSAPAFRRELRRSILIESVVLHLRRGDETLARIVFLDGIPTDPARLAPPPRKVPPKP
jgi:hypothetical protein